MTQVRKFANAKASVGEARRFVAGNLAGYSPELLEVVELLISELASNCVRHTAGGFEIRVVGDGKQVRVEVTDWGHGQPVVRPLDPPAVSGRGLAIVDMLATSWGVIDGPSAGGKTVWFVLDVADLACRPGPMSARQDATGSARATDANRPRRLAMWAPLTRRPLPA